MFTIIILFTITSFDFIIAQPSPYSFKNQFIGNYSKYVTAKDELRRNYCNNYWCTNDAHYLFTKSSQYPNVNPCVDFKNFSVNQVEEVDVPDDRTQFRGFNSIIIDAYDERIRKVVSANFDPIKDANNRVIKIVKNTFRQCIKSKHALRHIQAHKDIVEYLQSLGGSPYLSKHIHFNHDKFNEATDYGIDDLWTNNVPNSFNEDELWTGENFNVSRYFEIEPWFALNLFFNLEVKRCENDKICLKKPENSWEFKEDEESDFDDFRELLRTLDDAFRMRPQLRKILAENLYFPAVRRMRKFLKKREEIEAKFRNFEWTKIKIGELKKKIPEFDWVKIINSEFFEESKLSEYDEIFIDVDIEMLQELAENIFDFDKKTISDTFTILFIYSNRFQIILRFHNYQDIKDRGTKHGWQRWNTCINQYSFHQNMQPALLVMYEQYRSIWDRTLGDFDRDLSEKQVNVGKNAEKFIYEIVDEFKRRFLIESAKYLSVKVAADVLFKLKNLKVLIGLPKSIFSISKLEEFYKDLNLNGNESFLISHWEIEKHHRKLRNEPKTNWKRQIDEIVNTYPNILKYNIDDGNILYLSPSHIIYPIYHPLRPMFFNMNSMFGQIFGILFQDVKNYVANKYKINFNPVSSLPIQVAYEYYKNWLQTHNEFQIGANYLTNKQLFWVASAVFQFKKYHRTVPKILQEENRLKFEYLHVFMKFHKGFQEAFNCSLTKDEKKKISEYLHKNKIIRNKNG